MVNAEQQSQQVYGSSQADNSWYYSTGHEQINHTSSSQSTQHSQNFNRSSQLSTLLFAPLYPRTVPSTSSPNNENTRQVTTPLEDMYQPRWIRKEGKDREGWCSYCVEGKWLNLKHSNYAYHMLTRHGLCKAVGWQFEPPQTLHISQLNHTGNGGSGSGNTGNSNNGEQDVLHAYCQNCQRWIQLVGNPTVAVEHPRLTASWYSHAKECGVGVKIMDELIRWGIDDSGNQLVITFL
ncbi:uncharacterized protein KY384_000975 [Bacidia gigantensis]|uniref:uncharacterized protein n=1 Tax=Bacidia gigantensis TaxID=2732470 RepID=UPI001D040C9E|nr:uncharacterized protein KY384_000975 [Bacidia gigantensis]KAG8534131.1 hypothetical protein KY384_000975 [Bacidia gigantensis]